MSNSVSISEAREALGGIVNRVSLRGERILLSKNGKDIAAVVSLTDLELLRQLEDQRDIAEADRRMMDPAQKPVPYKEVRKQMGL